MYPCRFDNVGHDKYRKPYIHCISFQIHCGIYKLQSDLLLAFAFIIFETYETCAEKTIHFLESDCKYIYMYMKEGSVESVESSQ